MAAAAGVPNPQLIDQRGIAKVPTFSGRREHFEEWAFPFESYCGLLGWERFLDSAKVSPDEIEIINLSDEAEAVGRSLYHLLVSSTKGTALSIVRLIERGNGFEAYRKLTLEFRPHLNEEHGVMLQMILTPTWWTERTSKQNFHRGADRMGRVDRTLRVGIKGASHGQHEVQYHHGACAG